MKFEYYDVLAEKDGRWCLFPLILAISEADARHIIEVRYNIRTLDADLSDENPNTYNIKKG